MKLLIITQKVDKNDPILGFFHRWIEEFSKHYQSLIVICLEKGEYDLPKNLKVLSLGKEEGKSKLGYVYRFYRYIWQERANYDSVFVHMNQEYVLLAGDLWRLMGKRVMLWRNHAQGNILTRMAVMMSHKVFCTSPQSYTAQFKKTKIMPVGIDTDFFKPDLGVKKVPNSALLLGRVAPVKRVLEFVEWLSGTEYLATIAGPVGNEQYNQDIRSKIKELKLENRVKFVGAVSREEARDLYCSHSLYVNMTPAGSFDKTIFEAASCGTGIKVENNDLKFLEKMSSGELRRFIVENHSLKKLVHNMVNAT